MSEQRNGYVINDRRGSPRAYDHGLFKTPQGQGGYRPRPQHTGDTPKLITEWGWKQQVVLARQIFARLAFVHGAVCQKNFYAVGCGWRFHYSGEDAFWGAEAEEYINELWYPNCDIRGEPYDFAMDLYLDGCAIDRDGDEAMILRRTQDLGDYEGPVRLQWVSAHRIADGKAKMDSARCHAIVEEGPFKGARICNGVIKNRDNTTIGYRIIEEDDKQLDLPANSCQVLFEPDWNDLERGLPRSVVSCLDALDVEDINQFLKRQVKLDSAQGIQVTNEKGAPMAGSELIGADELVSEGDQKRIKDVEVEYLEGNEINYFKTSTGGKIEPVKSDRPHPNVESFIARIETQCIFSIGWFRQLMDPSKIGGASVRAIQDQARKSVAWRQKTLRKRAIRATVAALADAQNRGVIRKNDAEKWWLKLTFSMPELLTVDSGYDEKADLEHLANGTTTRGIVSGKKGRDWATQVFPQQSRELDMILEAAAEKAARHKVPISLVLNMMARIGTGGVPMDATALDPAAEETLNTDKPSDSKEKDDA